MMRIDDPTPRIEHLRRTGMSDSVIVSLLMLEGWSEEDFAQKFAPRITSPSGSQTHNAELSHKASLSASISTIVLTRASEALHAHTLRPKQDVFTHGFASLAHAAFLFLERRSLADLLNRPLS